MEQVEKIKKLLKTYGAKDEEIDNFIKDLEDYKEEAEEEQDNEPYILNAETLNVLKATKEGRDLILKAPKLKKEELAEEIKKFIKE